LNIQGPYLGQISQAIDTLKAMIIQIKELDNAKQTEDENQNHQVPKLSTQEAAMKNIVSTKKFNLVLWTQGDYIVHIFPLIDFVSMNLQFKLLKVVIIYQDVIDYWISELRRSINALTVEATLCLVTPDETEVIVLTKPNGKQTKKIENQDLLGTCLTPSQEYSNLMIYYGKQGNFEKWKKEYDQMELDKFVIFRELF
jgi:hypothetical protein